MADAEEDRESGEFPFGDRKVRLYPPSSGQMLVILTLLDLEDEEEQDEQVEMVLNFGTVIRKLFVTAEDRKWVHRGLAEGRFELEDYMGLARALVEEYAPDRAASNRAERRAPAKKAAPAKRVSARARR